MRATIFDFVKNDFLVAVNQPRRWVVLSQRSLSAINRRSSLGNLWLGLTPFIFVSALSVVYSSLFAAPLAVLIPYIAIGYVVWQMISGLILTAPNIFIANAVYLKSKPLPLSLFVFASVFEKLMIFFWQGAVIIAACLVFQTGISWQIIILPISLAIIVMTAIGIGFAIGVASLKYGDIGNLLSSSMTIVFLCTPVLWQRDVLAGRGWIADFNPFYHYIEIVRAPILSHTIPVLSLLVCSICLILVNFVGIYLIARYKSRIVYWL